MTTLLIIVAVIFAAGGLLGWSLALIAADADANADRMIDRLNDTEGDG